jgi:hypothetical protein
MILIRVTAVAAHAPIEPAWPRGNLDRVRLVRELSQMPGRHLVIVRYGTNPAVDHDPDCKFVQNAADIDNEIRLRRFKVYGRKPNTELPRETAKVPVRETEGTSKILER